MLQPSLNVPLIPLEIDLIFPDASLESMEVIGAIFSLFAGNYSNFGLAIYRPLGIILKLKKTIF